MTGCHVDEFFADSALLSYCFEGSFGFGPGFALISDAWILLLPEILLTYRLVSRRLVLQFLDRLGLFSKEKGVAPIYRVYFHFPAVYSGSQRWIQAVRL